MNFCQLKSEKLSDLLTLTVTLFRLRAGKGSREDWAPAQNGRLEGRGGGGGGSERD